MTEELSAAWERLLDAHAAEESQSKDNPIRSSKAERPTCPVAEGMLQSVYSRYDRNGDGKLNMEEFAQLVGDYLFTTEKEGVAKMFDELDIDGNKLIDYEEFRALTEE